MTATLIALYKTPKDKAKFDAHYNDVHEPLAKKMPGLQSFTARRITKGVMGNPDVYLIAEMAFASRADLDAALQSPEGFATGKDAMTFAGNLLQLMISEP